MVFLKMMYGIPYGVMIMAALISGSTVNFFQTASSTNQLCAGISFVVNFIYCIPTLLTVSGQLLFLGILMAGIIPILAVLSVSVAASSILSTEMTHISFVAFISFAPWLILSAFGCPLMTSICSTATTITIVPIPDPFGTLAFVLLTLMLFVATGASVTRGGN